MANEAQLAILMRGVERWNRWWGEKTRVKPDLTRAKLQGMVLSRTDLSGVDLSGANLSKSDLSKSNLSRSDLEDTNLREAILREVNLSEANLIGVYLIAADLRHANLSGANLRDADLEGANLRYADLSGANLSGANLNQADLEDANLRDTDLRDADLRDANLSRADLSRADLSHTDLDGSTVTQSYFGYTVVTGVNLRTVKGLNTVRHDSPSSIGIDTLYRSRGDIPEIFLRGCGVPDSMIEYARALVAAERPIDYYSCFISYSSHDEALAQRLYADLQAKGVRCWFAPHDLRIGESILGGIDQGIRLHDKLLLLLSEASVQSAWVETEVKLALQRERAESRRVLFPVRIDDAVLTSGAAWATLIRADHHIGDFCAWKDHDLYHAVFARLLRDLRAG